LKARKSSNMKSRINHGGSCWLGAWLQDRCGQGFDLPEVEHLCRRIYYRFDGIPKASRAHLSWATLAILFAELARLGRIRTVGIEQIARDSELRRNLLTPDYRRVDLVYNQALGEAACERLRPRLVKV
jgi:hypothetical protein